MSFLLNFHYHKTGNSNGPKLVFLHGLMGYAQNWRKIAQAFESDYEVLTFDQRGHGRSFQPQTGYSPEDYAEDLYLILENLGWREVYLVGHSMGGRNALCFAARFPDTVKKLVLEDISPEPDEEALNRYTHLIESVPTPFLSKLQAKEFFMNEFMLLAKNSFQPQTLGQYLYSNIEEKIGGTADWRFSKNAILSSLREGRNRSHWEDLIKISMPTLVIRGEKSRDLSREVFDKMLQCNSHVQGVEIAGSGHWVHFDKSEEFIKSVRAFFLQN